MHLTRFFFPVLFLLLGLGACDSSSDPEPDQNQALLLQDSSETRGRLFVDVLDTLGNPVQDARVTLYAESGDIDKGLVLFEFFSDRKGQVDFGFINFGTYYLLGESDRGDGRRNGRGAVMVFAQSSVRKPLILK